MYNLSDIVLQISEGLPSNLVFVEMVFVEKIRHPVTHYLIW